MAHRAIRDAMTVPKNKLVLFCTNYWTIGLKNAGIEGVLNIDLHIKLLLVITCKHAYCRLFGKKRIILVDISKQLKVLFWTKGFPIFNTIKPI